MAPIEEKTARKRFQQIRGKRKSKGFLEKKKIFKKKIEKDERREKRKWKERRPVFHDFFQPIDHRRVQANRQEKKIEVVIKKFDGTIAPSLKRKEEERRRGRSER